MELGGETTSKWSGSDLQPIARTRTIMLREVVGSIGAYANAPKVVTEAGTTMTVTPVDTSSTTITYETAGALTVESLARIVFETTVCHVKFTPEQASAMFDWSEGLMDDMLDDAHKATYNMAPADLELFEILRK